MAVKHKNIRVKRLKQARRGSRRTTITGKFMVKRSVQSSEITTLRPGAPRTQEEARARIAARVRADQAALDALAEL